jgi:ATP-dependent helicase/nuclease subunit A
MIPYENDYAAVVADTKSNVLIQASAGTGKTYNLVQRVLSILRNDRVPIDQILVLTFTNPAAAEMQSRIYEGIKKAEVDSVDDSERSFFSEQKLRFRKHHIGTIHSFAGRVIRQSSDELSRMREYAVPVGYGSPQGLEGTGWVGWTSSYELIDEFTSSILSTRWRQDFIGVHNNFESVTRLLSVTGSMGSFFEVLDKAAKLPDGVLRDIASMPDEELITITSGYASNLKHEMVAPFGRLKELATTFRACLDRDFPDTLDDFLLDGSDWYRKDGKISARRVPRGTETLTRDEVQKKFDRALPRIKSLIDLFEMHANLVAAIKDGKTLDNPSGTLDAATFANMKLIGEVALRWKQYHRWRRATDGLMNFDDLIDVSHRLIIDNSNVRERMQSKFRHILVDEFQDTDARQWEMIKHLEGGDASRMMFLVGDMKQAIYGFRGGNVSLIRKVEEKAADKPESMRLATLKVSRRSKKEIIEYVNGLFQAVMNPVAHERMFQADYMPLEPLMKQTKDEPELAAGSVRYLSYLPMPGFTSQDGDAELKQVGEFVSQGPAVIDAYSLAKLIADIRDDINAEMYPEYRNIGDLLRAGKKAIGILISTQANVDHLMTAFRLFGIQAAVRAGSGFFDRQEISDMYYLIRFLDDAWDDMALAAVLRSPYFSVSDLGLLAIANSVKASPVRTSWWKVLQEKLNELVLIDTDRVLLAKAVVLLKDWRTTVRGKRVSDILMKSILQTAFLYGQSDTEMARENTYKLIGLIRDIEDRGNAGIGQISNWLRVQLENTSSSDAVVPGSSSIEVITMHRSKGLQYPMVILSNVSASGQSSRGMLMSPIDTHDNHTPLLVWQSADDKEEADGEEDSFLKNYIKRQIGDRENAEMLRLLYVALTRAESHIVISDPSGLSNGYKNSAMQTALGNHLRKLIEGDVPYWFQHKEYRADEYKVLLDMITERVNIGQRVDMTTLNLDWVSSKNLDSANSRASAPLSRPSDLKEDDFESDAEWLSQWKVLRSNDAGTLIHMIIEWPELDDSTLDLRLSFELEGLEYNRNQVGLDDDIRLLKRHAANARAFIGQHFPNAKQLISELPFETWMPDVDGSFGSWARGTIDLLIEDENGDWYIIDFKTANVPPEHLEKFIVSRKYHSQIQQYIVALNTSSQGNINVAEYRAMLLFTGYEGGKAVSISNLNAKK